MTTCTRALRARCERAAFQSEKCVDLCCHTLSPSITQTWKVSQQRTTTEDQSRQAKAQPRPVKMPTATWATLLTDRAGTAFINTPYLQEGGGSNYDGIVSAASELHTRGSTDERGVHLSQVPVLLEGQVLLLTAQLYSWKTAYETMEITQRLTAAELAAFKSSVRDLEDYNALLSSSLLRSMQEIASLERSVDVRRDAV